MKTTAAILVELNRPLELWDLEIPALGAGQVLVEVAFSGVCHTQVLEARGRRGKDAYLPHCLGHEGSGVVLEVGANVRKVKAGDRVVLSWLKGSGADVPGVVYGSSNDKVNAGAVTTFNRHAVVSENRLTVLPRDVPSDSAVLLGCAMPTGLGSVIHAGQASTGESCVILGCGGVGMCAVAGAVMAGCSPVIAVDLAPEKLAVARSLGATHTIHPAQEELVKKLAELCPGGVDLAIEATGKPVVMTQALEIVRPRGGRAVVIGNAPAGSQVAIDPKHFNQGKRLLGTWGGDSDPDRDYPRYARLLAGEGNARLRVEPMLTRGYGLTTINQALDDLEAGKAMRPLIDLTLGV
ncbi:MAG: zinc-binding dehydrogenase [Phycisphaeraceae bacterium]|nr:zinc-binding dehydrogenase [Phycisphaeraceae bacterium]